MYQGRRDMYLGLHQGSASPYLLLLLMDVLTQDVRKDVGETGARSYRGRLLQGHFMQNYYIDGEIADSSSILIHQGNYRRNKTIDACELYEIRTKITFYTPETFLRMFTTFLLVQSIMKTGL